MRLKTSKIIFFSIFLFSFGIAQTINALNYTNSLQITEKTDQFLAKEGGNKKSGSKKSGSKKSGSKKSRNKKSDNKKNIRNEKKSRISKVENNQKAMKEAAKERYEIWKKNRQKNKNKI